MSIHSARFVAGVASALVMSATLAVPARADGTVSIDDAPASVLAGTTATVSVSGCDSSADGEQVGITLRYTMGRVETYPHFAPERPWVFSWEVPVEATGSVSVEANCVKRTPEGVEILDSTAHEVTILPPSAPTPTAAPVTASPEPTPTAPSPTAEPTPTAPSPTAEPTPTAPPSTAEPTPTAPPSTAEPEAQPTATAAAPGPVATAPAPAASLSTSTVTALRPLTVTGEGFTPRETVEVWLHSDPRLLTAVTADANGTVRAIVIIPADTTPGTHTLELVGTSSGRRLSADLTVISSAQAMATKPASTRPALAQTGPATALGLAALGLAGAGGLVLNRRRAS